MACPRCTNATYPAEYEEIPRKIGEPVRCCKRCKYPTVSAEVRRRLGLKLRAIQPALSLGRGLKGIGPEYFGEILDTKHRPQDELKPLYEAWDKERVSAWVEERDDPGNFYDWIEKVEAKSTVLQLDEMSRGEFAAKIEGGKLIGNLVTAKHSEYAFVLSPGGVFYTAPKQTSGDVRIHHSSFLSGEPVLAAGVFFCNGAIEGYSRNIFYVKDYSGHYRPGIPEILHLKKKFIDLNEGNVSFWYVNGGSSPHWKGPIQEFDTESSVIIEIVERVTKKSMKENLKPRD